MIQLPQDGSLRCGCQSHDGDFSGVEAEKSVAGIAAAGYFRDGELAERSNAAVLKTVVLQGTGGSNPSLSVLIFCPYS